MARSALALRRRVPSGFAPRTGLPPLTAEVDSNAVALAQTRTARSPRSGTRSLPIRTPPAAVAEPRIKGRLRAPPAGALWLRDRWESPPTTARPGWVVARLIHPAAADPGEA